jgi:hypothetical protein
MESKIDRLNTSIILSLENNPDKPFSWHVERAKEEARNLNFKLADYYSVYPDTGAKYAFSNLRIGGSFYVGMDKCKSIRTLQASVIGCSKKAKGEFTTSVTQDRKGVVCTRIK